MKKGKSILCALLVPALLLGSVCAATAGKMDAGFAVWPLLPRNQIDPEAPYFYLDVKPGEEQTLRIQLSNGYDHDIMLSLEANTAFSSGSGLIAYTKSEERDPSLVMDFATLTTIPVPMVTVPANSQAVADILLKMPDEPLEGEMLGGIIITKLPDEIANTARKSTMITNVYTYAIAVRIRQEDAVIEPEFEVLGAREGVLAGGPILEIDIRNPKPLVVKGMTLDASIRSDETGETVMRFTAERLNMAPNSVMPYTKLLTKEPLAPGSYQVDSKLSSGETTWEFTSPLVIGAR